jgi:hypothetical protein
LSFLPSCSSRNHKVDHNKRTFQRGRWAAITGTDLVERFPSLKNNPQFKAGYTAGMEEVERFGNGYLDEVLAPHDMDALKEIMECREVYTWYATPNKALHVIWGKIERNGYNYYVPIFMFADDKIENGFVERDGDVVGVYFCVGEVEK